MVDFYKNAKNSSSYYRGSRYLSRVSFSENAQRYWNSLIDLLYSETPYIHQYAVIQIWKSFSKEMQLSVHEEMKKARKFYEESDLYGLLLDFSMMRGFPNADIVTLNKIICYLESVAISSALNERARRNLLILFYNTRGLSYADCGKYGNGLPDFERALRISCNYTVAMNNIGCIYFHQEMYKEAKQYFLKAVSILPNAEYYFNLGTTEKLQKNYEEAIKMYSLALQREPNHYGALYNRGDCCVKLKDYEQSIKDFSRAIDVDPNGSSALSGRASAYEKLGLCVMAVKDFASVKSIVSNIQHNLLLEKIKRSCSTSLL